VRIDADLRLRVSVVDVRLVPADAAAFDRLIADGAR